MHSSLRNNALILVFVAGVSYAQAPAAPAAQPPAKSTAAAAVPAVHEEPKTISEVYNGVGVRDPFVSILASGGMSATMASEETPKPNIHNLQLRGMLGSLAMLEDASSGTRFLLKGDGRIYDIKGKVIPGITGQIKSGNSVLLTTSADGDVQWLKLGEQK